MVTLAPIPPGALAKYDPQINFPTIAEAGWDGNNLLGMGGLSWTHGRCWLWYAVVDRNHHGGNSVHPHLIVRGGLRMLRRARQMGETQVFAWRDESEPSSKRLLEVIGFSSIGTEYVATTEGKVERKEVWLWQAK